MKVLITGATGGIGHEVLIHLLQYPAFTSVVALSRRDMSTSSLPNAHKFRNIVMKDFSNWSGDIMEQIQDADAMFWAMGTNTPEPGPNKDWPLAFQTAMCKARDARSSTTRFRFVALSGKLVEQDQDAGLWFLAETRKLKGRYETACLEFAEQHKERWQTFILKPAGVIVPSTTRSNIGRGILSWLMGSWGIMSEELGAFVAELMASGEEEESLVYNERLVEKGRRLLEMNRERR